MSFPVHYEPAPVAYRVCAAGINFMAFGFVSMVWGRVVGDGTLTQQTYEASRALLCGILTLLWLIAVVRRSPGSALCLLENRAPSGEPLKIWQRALWSLPYYLFCLIMLAPLSLNPAFAMMRAIVVFAGLLALAIDGAALLFTGRSFRDRAVGVVVLRLSLPANLKPRLFGRPLP